MNKQLHEAKRISLTGDRQNNQDRSIVLESGSTTLLAVADGLGGHPKGEVAAQLFIDTCEHMLRRAEQPIRDPRRFMYECIQRAHHAIINFGDRQTPPICPRSTAVMAIVQYGKAWWAHVGDSRLYLIRESSILVQTHDHSLVHSIDQPPTTGKSRSAITRSLGGLDQPPEISFGIPMSLQEGDTLLLCTDGLWNQVPQDDLISLLSEQDLGAGLQRAGHVAASRPRSDNITAIALRWGPPPGRPAERATAGRVSDPLEETISELREVLTRGSTTSP
ncbi:PP2C family protein-serine/threonine phosphatase [endosymbiont of unidentified scaly snail isolate Monju]|uniref:PP2C family protein-serine/threonine phosphatase n=1 Tax=endosymbiont of unidentified scaly snail isolate Monju TaxID=1248727 RepID=UPI00038922F5|nr:protein phosphatase 2C domain-containing protein [endosymbiont of unidentified scaly snail isolate Monju]BAN69920.1 serine/threonine phosphatase [endosymbiont of unidentified scaly snail isolate Monju]